MGHCARDVYSGAVQPNESVSKSPGRGVLGGAVALLLLGAATPPEQPTSDALVAEALEAFSGAVDEVDAAVQDETASRLPHDWPSSSGSSSTG